MLKKIWVPKKIYDSCPYFCGISGAIIIMQDSIALTIMGTAIMLYAAMVSSKRAFS